ncbi:hypothetical protein [Actinomadura chokoriensis]
MATNTIAYIAKNLVTNFASIRGFADDECSGTDVNGAPIPTTVSAQTPWSGGSIPFDSAHIGGRDGEYVIPGFKVNLWLENYTHLCTFKGELRGDLFNITNPARPDADLSTQVRIDQVVPRDPAGAGGCPAASMRVQGILKFLGAPASGGGPLLPMIITYVSG